MIVLLEGPVAMPEPYFGGPSASYPTPTANMPLPYAVHPAAPLSQPAPVCCFRSHLSAENLVAVIVLR